MVNKKLWMGMLVMALAFGMAVVGCGNNSANNDNIQTGGLTVTGIPARYNGLFAGVFDVGTDSFMEYHNGEELVNFRYYPPIEGFASYDPSTSILRGVRITDGTVSIPMWIFDDNWENHERWYGNLTLGFEFEIFSTETGENSARWYNLFFYPVPFTNGNATIIFDSYVERW